MSHGAIGEAGSSVAASGSATGSYLQLITRNHRRSRRPHRRTNTQTQTASQQVSGSYSESDSSVLGHSPRVSHVRTEEYTDTANCDRHAQKHKSKPTHKQTSSVSAGHTDKPQTYKQTQTYTHAHRRRTDRRAHPHKQTRRTCARALPGIGLRVTRTKGCVFRTQ